MISITIQPVNVNSLLRSVLRNVTDNNGQYGFLQEWEPVFCTPDGMDKYFYIRHETAAQSFLTDCRAQDAKTVENCQLPFKGILRVKRDKHDYLRQSRSPCHEFTSTRSLRAGLVWSDGLDGCERLLKGCRTAAVPCTSEWPEPQLK